MPHESDRDDSAEDLNQGLRLATCPVLVLGIKIAGDESAVRPKFDVEIPKPLLALKVPSGAVAGLCPAREEFSDD